MKDGSRSLQDNDRIPDGTIRAEVKETRLSTDESASVDEISPTEAVQEYITGPTLVTLVASLTIVLFLVLLDMSIIVTAIPRITNRFHSLPDVGWYGSSYLLASCALQPLAGKLYSLYKSKVLFLTFLAIFELGSTLCGAAQSSKMLIISRAVAGIGVAGLTNGALTILAASVPMHKRPALFGIMMSVAQMGIICGPIVGGALTEYASWRWCFFINLPAGAVASVFVFLIRIPDEAHKRERAASGKKITIKDFDLIGFVLFTGFAVMILLAFQWGGTVYSWRSAMVIGLFCGGGAVLLVFLLWERHYGDDAMIPLGLIRQRVVWSSTLVILFFFGALFTFTYYLPIWFQAVKNASPLMSGVYLLPGILSQIVMATVSGFLVGRWGYYLPWAAVSAVFGSVAAGLLSTLEPHTSTAKWVGYQVIGGIGRGCGMQMSIVAVQNHLPGRSSAVATALLMFAQTFGGALFLSFDDTIFEHGLLSGLAHHAPEVDAQRVINAGATGFRHFLHGADLPGVLEAYSRAVGHDFYLAAAASAAAFVCCWGMGWKKIEKAKATTSEA